jgi:acyl-CoA synthetase (AMP-forming)/AMP-acid ligase II
MNLTSHRISRTGLVGDAVALGIDHERLGQHSVLAVSPANGRVEPDELPAELRRQRQLYLVPQQLVVRPSLPRSPSDKFDRNLRRQGLAAG